MAMDLSDLFSDYNGKEAYEAMRNWPKDEERPACAWYVQEPTPHYRLSGDDPPGRCPCPNHGILGIKDDDPPLRLCLKHWKALREWRALIEYDSEELADAHRSRRRWASQLGQVRTEVAVPSGEAKARPRIYPSGTSTCSDESLTG